MAVWPGWSRVARWLGRDKIDWSDAAALITRLDVRHSSLSVALDTASLGGPAVLAERQLVDRLTAGETIASAAGGLTVHVETITHRRGGRTWLLGAEGRAPRLTGKPQPRLVNALRRAHAILKSADLSPEAKCDECAANAAPGDAHDRKLCLLGFLAPDIQAAILDGRHRPDLTLEQLVDERLPLAWTDQRRVLGF